MPHNDYESPEHALAYLAKCDKFPHRAEGEGVLLSFLPKDSKRVLDLGCGDGRLLDLVFRQCPQSEGVAIDSSETMIEAAKQRFANSERVQVLHRDLNDNLRDLGLFDVIVSSFAIHHCPDERKRSLYAEVFEMLNKGGVFCNLEHVASPTPALHTRFLEAFGITADDEDPGNILLDVETQLTWLREIGFQDVDAYWKWLELCLMGGFRR